MHEKTRTLTDQGPACSACPVDAVSTTNVTIRASEAAIAQQIRLLVSCAVEKFQGWVVVFEEGISRKGGREEYEWLMALPSVRTWKEGRKLTVSRTCATLSCAILSIATRRKLHSSSRPPAIAALRVHSTYRSSPGIELQPRWRANL